MCKACWEGAGAPRIDNPLVRAAARAVAEVYEFSCVGGNLHIYIDDYNLEDPWFEGDEADRLVAEDVHEAGPEQLAAERYCLGLLRALTEEERYSAVALHHGAWSPAD